MDICFLVSFPESPAATRTEQSGSYLAFLKQLVEAQGGTITPFDAVMTEDEHEAMELSGKLANKVRKMCRGPQGDNDWNEAAIRIHGVQHMILAQAAARTYPHRYRAMGEVIPRLTYSKDSDTVDL